MFKATEVIKLNLGCGMNPLPGYLNVDKYGDPDLRCDLEIFPWPWNDNSVEEIVLNHVLEHLGETRDIYLGVIREMYRICKPDSIIKILVPHPRHDDFIADPTHVRPITPMGLHLFSKRLNRYWAENREANSPLGLYLDVDLELVKTNFVLEEPWSSQFTAKEITQEEIHQAAMRYNNVVKEIQMELKVIKEMDPSPPT